MNYGHHYDILLNGSNHFKDLYVKVLGTMPTEK